jgi:hypothetical protein
MVIDIGFWSLAMICVTLVSLCFINKVAFKNKYDAYIEKYKK